jgi:hypothetical protein
MRGQAGENDFTLQHTYIHTYIHAYIHTCIQNGGAASAGQFALALMRGQAGVNGFTIQQRIEMVQELPTTTEPPPDGDVCGVCRK